jgi:hypothetical protein
MKKLERMNTEKLRSQMSSLAPTKS